MLVTLRRQTSRYPDLTPGQRYAVIGIEADDFRLVDDRGTPYLYPHQLFDVVDPQVPEDWVWTARRRTLTSGRVDVLPLRNGLQHGRFLAEQRSP